MTTSEFLNEFRFKYDAASNGGPDLNIYEISLCLAKAQSDIIHEAYKSYETNEISKRIIAPLLKNYSPTISPSNDNFTGYKTYSISLPSDLKFIIADKVKFKNCSTNSKIEVIDLDHLSEALNNPFKRPNKRKVIRVEEDKTKLKIYSSEELDKYEIKYIKQELPIIVLSLSLDTTLMGDETISGIDTETNSELPDFIHDDIVDKAVLIAIKSVRANSLQSQIQIK